MVSDKAPEGMSFRELLLEVREDLKDLFDLVHKIDDAAVKKSEFDMWQETMRQNRRWAITTIISLFVLGLMALGIAMSLPPS